MCWNRTSLVGECTGVAVVAVDCSCASSSQLASSALHCNSGTDHCCLSSHVRLNIYCRETEKDEMVEGEEEDNPDDSQRIVAFRGKEEREGDEGNYVVEEADAELHAPSVSKSDNIAYVAVAAAPHSAAST